jgi:tetratricopeptide (TPR) repeat protein
MRRMPWATYLWPGLPQLWFSGFWSGLALAMGFALLLNWMLLASFVWVELLDPFGLRLGWLAIGSLWVGSAIISVWYGRRGPVLRGATSAEVLFREALNEYLLGSWFEAESILGRLLRLYPRDAEGRLLLATLLRHTRRYDEALDQLNRLERLRDSDQWVREIAAEKRRIAAGQTSRSATTGPEPTPEIAIPPLSQQAA